MSPPVGKIHASDPTAAVGTVGPGQLSNAADRLEILSEEHPTLVNPTFVAGSVTSRHYGASLVLPATTRVQM